MTTTEELIYAYRVMRLPVLDAGGRPIGKVDDIVVVPGRGRDAPRVLGFVVNSQRGGTVLGSPAVPVRDELTGGPDSGDSCPRGLGRGPNFYPQN